MKKLAAILMFLPSFALAQPLALQYGVNRVDINADGQEDFIIKARWENFNAHLFDRFLVMLQGDAGMFYDVPLGEKADYTFQTVEGAGCLEKDISFMTDYQFALDAQGWLQVTKLSRTTAQGYGQAEPITVTRYVLTDFEAEEGHVLSGFPPFYLKQTEQEVTNDSYCDVREIQMN